MCILESVNGPKEYDFTLIIQLSNELAAPQNLQIMANKGNENL